MSEAVRYAGFTVRTECSHCGNPLPLHGPLLSVLCPSCLNEARVPQSIWQPILEAFDEQHERLTDGQGAVAATTADALPVRHEHRKRLPACEKCSKPFAVEQLPVGADQDFSCTQCGDPASTHPVPEWLQRLVPTARQFYSTDPGAARTGAVPLDAGAAIKPVVMSCPSCGGALSATSKSERIMACQYCQADVYLPDEIWRRLHPVPTVKEWFIRFEGKTREELVAEAHAVRAAEERRRRDERQSQEAERLRKEQVRTEALVAERQLELRREMTAMVRSAYVAAVLFVLTLGAAFVVSWFGYRGALPLDKSTQETTIFVLLGSSLVVLVVALVFVGRPIKKASGHDNDWMIFCTWFWVPFSLMPVVGQLIALLRVFILFRGKFGASSITTNNVSTRSYAAVRLEHGEARPASIVFLALALLYPMTALSVVAPEELDSLLSGDTDVMDLIEESTEPGTRGVGPIPK